MNPLKYLKNLFLSLGAFVALGAVACGFVFAVALLLRCFVFAWQKGWTLCAAICVSSVCICGSIFATPVYFPLLGITGSANNRDITLIPDPATNALTFNNALIVPQIIQLHPTGGAATNNLLPWGFTMRVDTCPRSWHFVVPNSTNLENVVTLITNALALGPPLNPPPAGFTLCATNYGIVGDGSTDNTAAISNFFALPGVKYFPPGNYLSQELVIPSNTRLYGAGATLTYANNDWNTNVFVNCKLNTNISIEGLALNGGFYTNIDRYTYNTANANWGGVGGGPLVSIKSPYFFMYWQALGYRHGLLFNVNGVAVKDVTITGFNGAGALPVSTLGNLNQHSTKPTVSALNCSSNLVGIFASGDFGIYNNIYTPNWVTDYVGAQALPAEYATFANCLLVNNGIGAVVSAANDRWVGCGFDSDVCGVWATAGATNSGHGSMVGCSFNHELVYSAYFDGVNGYTIGESVFAGNGIVFNNGTKGVIINNCKFGGAVNGVSITNTGSAYGCYNYVLNNVYSGTWSSYSVANDGNLLVSGNTSYDVWGDTDGSMAATFLTSRDGSGLTNLNPGGLTTNLQFTFALQRTNTLYFTNGVLMRVSQP